MGLVGNGTTPATNDRTDLLGTSGDCIGALCEMFCDPDAKGYDSTCTSGTGPPCGARDPVKYAYLDTKANRTRAFTLVFSDYYSSLVSKDTSGTAPKGLLQFIQKCNPQTGKI